MERGPVAGNFTLAAPGAGGSTAGRPRESPAGGGPGRGGRAERPDYRPLLRELDLPAFVCTGDRDVFSTAQITDELTDCLRRPYRVTLADAGHLPNLESPDRFNAELEAFLGQAAAG